MSIIDNLNSTTQTGKPNSHRAVYRFGEWSVESTDSSGTWVCADPNPGRTYASRQEAVDEARSLAAALDGTYVGAVGIQHQTLDVSPGDAADIDVALAAIASERGLSYE